MQQMLRGKTDVLSLARLGERVEDHFLEAVVALDRALHGRRGRFVALPQSQQIIAGQECGHVRAQFLRQLFEGHFAVMRVNLCAAAALTRQPVIQP